MNKQLTQDQIDNIESVVSALLSRMGKDMHGFSNVQVMVVMSSLVVNLQNYMFELLDQDHLSQEHKDNMHAKLKDLFTQISTQTEEALEKLEKENE